MKLGITYESIFDPNPVIFRTSIVARNKAEKIKQNKKIKIVSKKTP